jgi:glycosyltransferase involved in cell wall biosynthesis
LRATDIFLLPSVSEGLPVALLEAMAYGLAIIATRTGGIPEVLTDDIDALLVPPADARALAEAALSLTDNPERRARLGLAAQRRAAALNVEDVCATLDALYREVLSTR